MVKDSPCNPWKTIKPPRGGAPQLITWLVQFTAPLPLEAISNLFSKAVAGKPSSLLPSIGAGRGMTLVTRQFFQSNPNTISSTSVKDDVLGFFSLILSYAKSARKENSDSSPKVLTVIMPRTDFTTVFAQVKSAVPLKPNSLYELVKVLACYKNEDNGEDVR